MWGNGNESSSDAYERLGGNDHGKVARWLAITWRLSRKGKSTGIGPKLENESGSRDLVEDKSEEEHLSTRAPQDTKDRSQAREH